MIYVQIKNLNWFQMKTVTLTELECLVFLDEY
jgi:hypothetical protein